MSSGWSDDALSLAWLHPLPVYLTDHVSVGIFFVPGLCPHACLFAHTFTYETFIDTLCVAGPVLAAGGVGFRMNQEQPSPVGSSHGGR